MRQTITEDWFDCPLELIDVVLEYTDDTIYILEDEKKCFGFTIDRGTCPYKLHNYYEGQLLSSISINEFILKTKGGAELVWIENFNDVHHISDFDDFDVAVKVLKKLKYVYENELGNYQLTRELDSETVINRFREINGCIRGLVYSEEDIFVERLM